MAQRSAHLSRLKQFERGTETLLARIDDLSHAEKCGLLDAAFQYWSQACLEKWDIDLLHVVRLCSNSNKNSSEVPVDEHANPSLVSEGQPSARTLRASRRKCGQGLSRLSAELRLENEAVAENEELLSTTPTCDASNLNPYISEHSPLPTLPILPASAPTAPTAPMTLPTTLPMELSAAIPELTSLPRRVPRTALSRPLPTAPLPKLLPAPILDSNADAAASDEEPLSMMAKRVRRVKNQSSVAWMTTVVDSIIPLESSKSHDDLVHASVPKTTQLPADGNSSDEEPLCTTIQRIKNTGRAFGDESQVPIVQVRVTDPTTDTLQDSLAPIVAFLERGTESPAAKAPDQEPVLENERAPKRQKVSKIVFARPMAESTIPAAADVESISGNVINDEEVAVIVREVMAEHRHAGIYGKVGQEAKVLKLVKMVIRGLSLDGTQALHRLLPLEDDWINTEAWTFQQDHRNAASRLEQLFVAYYTFRNVDQTRPFGSCLRNMSLITLSREHEQLVTEVRTPYSATRRAVEAMSSESVSKAPVSMLNAYVAQKVNILEAKSSSVLTALDVLDIGPDVLAGKILNKYASSLGRGILFLFHFSKRQLAKYTLDEHQAVVNTLARRKDLVKMCRIISDYIMKPMLEEKVTGLRKVKTFLARWNGHIKNLEYLVKNSKPEKKTHVRIGEDVDYAEAGKYTPAVRQDSAVYIQAE